jgi:hypothetical protein
MTDTPEIPDDPVSDARAHARILTESLRASIDYIANSLSAARSLAEVRDIPRPAPLGLAQAEKDYAPGQAIEIKLPPNKDPYYYAGWLRRTERHTGLEVAVGFDGTLVVRYPDFDRPSRPAFPRVLPG